MASTTALFTGLTGLNANSRNIDVIGNNIANVNTTAFKSARLNFSTLLSRTYSAGSGPGAASGGTNPYQVGLGVSTSGTQRNFTSGTLSPTGDPRDMAIDGDGFFVVRRGEGQWYTRAGNFRTDSAQYLSTPTGERLQGYAVDDQFNIVPGRTTDVRIPLGTLTIADPTQNVRFRGNLNADGTLPAQGARITLMGTSTTGLLAASDAVPLPNPGDVLETTTRLLDIEDPALPGSNTRLFASGQGIQLYNAQRGGRTLPTQTYTIDAASTLADLQAFLSEALGINPATGANPDARTPGVSLDPVTGVLSIVGNTGVVNDLVVNDSDLRVVDAAGTYVRQPFVTAKAAAADGEGVRTAYEVYDSLGTPVQVRMAMVLDSRSDAGTRWRYMLESDDSLGASTQLGTGLLSFGTDGQLVSGSPVTLDIDRSGTGATTPLSISLFFSQGQDSVTALTDSTSSIAATYRDGAPIGTLSSFGVGADGVITGSFTNGLARTLAQVALATFANNEGLLDAGNNLFQVGVNSGQAVITAPDSLGAGRVAGGALELSNVDIGEEFIKMISSSTGYSASSRVIRTADELLQQLLVLGR